MSLVLNFATTSSHPNSQVRMRGCSTHSWHFCSRS